ncbi:hypothetical protein F2P56_011484 [Juglans regia]|uniref:Protein NUCLEAR FUSION DEFECTIVE 6, chloroplastic/mitochondrial-like n=2 Tax=Juglans regia TaxID=51240 RepID=A0A834CZP1_JUGRE|nr:uncharacterized protein LOC109011774 [Juglans regia]KAF5471005.1 hypothetical protein F2P56_011484 [Juglans regia]
MAASMAVGRSTLVRAMCRASKISCCSSATRRFSIPPSPSNFVPRRTPFSPHHPSPRLVRRELSSLLPIHSAIASACLVSKLPSEASNSTEGRFVSYLSPI